MSIQTPRWHYLVLGFPFLFEGLSLSIALRAFTGKHGAGQLLNNIIASKDATYTVIAEDSAALSGIVLGFVGILLNDRFHLPVFDGIAPVLIGLLLAAVS